MSVKLYGYLVEINSNKMKLMFCPDYNGTAIDFTKSFLLNKEKTINGTSPVSDNYFYVKCNNVLVGQFETEFKPIEDFIQHTVECTVKIKTYNFKDKTKQLIGWNINLLNIKLYSM